MWRHHYSGTQGIIFIVDPYDETKFVNIKEELYLLLDDDQLSDVPMLFMCNVKQQQQQQNNQQHQHQQQQQNQHPSQSQSQSELSIDESTFNKIQYQCGFKEYPRWNNRDHEARIMNLNTQEGQNRFVNDDLQWLIRSTKAL